jgi:hypothetical protein
MANCLDHPLDLMLTALMNGDLEPGIAFRLADLRHFRRCGKPVLQFDAPFEGLDLGIVEHAFHLDQISFRNMVAWMEQRLREIAMIGQQHEPFTIEIQPPNWKDPHRHAV